MICKECKEEVPNRAKCVYCGADAPTPEVPPEVDKPEEEKKNPLVD